MWKQNKIIHHRTSPFPKSASVKQAALVNVAASGIGYVVPMLRT
jgi:hypothetical protein